MPANILVQLAVGVALAVLSYVLRPKPPGPKPPSIDEVKAPTAEAGKPIPVVFGSVTIESPNTLWYGDISIESRKMKDGGK